MARDAFDEHYGAIELGGAMAASHRIVLNVLRIALEQGREFMSVGKKIGIVRSAPERLEALQKGNVERQGGPAFEQHVGDPLTAPRALYAGSSNDRIDVICKFLFVNGPRRTRRHLRLAR